MPKPAILTVAETVPKSFLLAVAQRGDATALREKVLGIWKSISWNDWLARAKEVAFALDAMGFRPGDVASVLANTVPEWCYADLGILCAGGVSSGIYPTDSTKQVAYLVNDSRTRVLFVEDDEQLDKALEAREHCPTLERIVIFDMEGLAEFADPMCMSFAAFLAEGRAHRAGREGRWDEMVARPASDDLAILVYTSGTTGPPKGAMLSHRNIVTQMKYASDALSYCEDDERVAFLPMCHVAERIAGCYYGIATGAVANYAESPETVLENVREVQPTLFGGVPRVWERLYSAITIALKDATPFQNWMYRRAMAVGYRMTDGRLDGEPPSLALRLANRAAYWLVFRNIRRMLGLDRCRIAFTGAAPIAPDLIRWYLALGIDMREVYGQTENCGVAALMPSDRIKLGSVGKAAPWGEVRISPEGEITTFAEGMGIATGLAFDKAGNLYVGDRSGTIFKIGADREIFVFATLEPSMAAYHLAFSAADELYVTGPTTSSFDRVYRINPAGEVSTFFRGLGRPQGLAFDRAGNLYVAASLGGQRGIVRLTPDAKPELVVSGSNIVGLALLPSRRAMITTNNALYSLDWDVQGLPLNG